jgi:PAS domain S-box-containing protein
VSPQSAHQIIVLDRHLGEVARARHFVADLAAKIGLPEERVFEIEVAVSEACANAIEHSAAEEPVTVEAAIHADRLEIRVEGRGEFEIPQSGANDRGHRGLGLPLMAKFSDHLALYSAADGGTLVALTFYLSGVPRGQSVSPPWLTELMGENEFVTAVTEAVPIGLYVLDADLRFRWANAALREFLEEPYRSAPLEGVLAGDAIPGFLEAGLADVMLNVSRSAETAFFPEYEHIGFARGVTHWRWQALPLRSEGPEPPFDVLVVVTEITEQVEQRKRLESASAAYRALAENSGLGLALCRTVLDDAGEAVDFEFVEVNQRYLELTGLEPERVVGKRVTEVIPGYRRERIALRNRVALSGEPREEEIYEPYLGRWYRTNLYCPEPGYFVSLFSDTSELKAAEERAATEKRRADLVAETAARLLASTDPRGLVEELCREVMAELGCHVFFNFLVSEEEGLLRLNAYAGIPEEEAQAIERLEYGVAVCGCAARDGVPIVAENILTTFDPRTDLVRSYGVQAYAAHPLISEGQVIGTLSFGTRSRQTFGPDELAVMRAVTDLVAIAMTRIRTQTRVLELTQRLTAHMEQSPLAVIEWGPDMRLVRWSTQAEEIFGWRAEEVLGQRIEDFRWVYEEDASHVDEVSLGLQHGSDPRNVSVNRNYRKDGSLACCEWYNSSLIDESGNLSSILSIVLDVTARVEAERERATLIEEQERLNQYLAVVNEELAAANEDLAAANEDLAAANEELQTQTEELMVVTENLQDSQEQQRERIALAEVLLDITRALHAARSRAEIIDSAVARGARGLGAETAALAVWEDNGFLISSAYGWPRDMVGTHVPAGRDRHAMLALESGRPVVIHDAASDPRVDSGLMEEFGIKSLVVAPCYVRARPEAALFFNFVSDRHAFTPAEEEFVAQLASSLSLALENATLAREQASLLERLQLPFLEMPGDIPEVEFAGEYRSATTGALIGGDFYDLYRLPDGRLALAVGDVSGHGLEASRYASMVKDSFSLLLLRGRRPKSVLAETNRFLIDRGVPCFVTAFLGVLDPATGRLVFASAGHPSPLVAHHNGMVRALALARSAPLGVFPDLGYKEHTDMLRDRDVLLLHTDGLLEARRNGALYGEHRLAGSLRRHCSLPISDLAAVIVQDAVEFADGTVRDDTAVLALRYRAKNRGDAGTARAADGSRLTPVAED